MQNKKGLNYIKMHCLLRRQLSTETRYWFDYLNLNYEQNIMSIKQGNILLLFMEDSLLVYFYPTRSTSTSSSCSLLWSKPKARWWTFWKVLEEISKCNLITDRHWHRMRRMEVLPYSNCIIQRSCPSKAMNNVHSSKVQGFYLLISA
jgi:hypothetical protein